MLWHCNEKIPNLEQKVYFITELCMCYLTVTGHILFQGMQAVMGDKLDNRTLGFMTRSDTNQPLHTQKKARI